MSTMETFTLDPAEVAAVIGDACLTEIRAFKPGNVSLASPGHGMSARDFIASADAMATVIALPGDSVGRRILRTIEATRAVVPFNTNLVIHVERREHRLQPTAQPTFARSLHHRVRKRRAQQDDPEVGVERHHRARGFYREKNAATYSLPRHGDHPCHRIGTRDEIPGAHPVAG